MINRKQKNVHCVQCWLWSLWSKKKRLGGVNSDVLQRIDTIQYCDEIWYFEMSCIFCLYNLYAFVYVLKHFVVHFICKNQNYCFMLILLSQARTIWTILYKNKLIIMELCAFLFLFLLILLNPFRQEKV